MKRYILFIIILIFSIISLEAQSYFQVKLNKEESIRLGGRNNKIQNILIADKTIKLVPSYPNTKNPDLMGYYDICVDLKNNDIKSNNEFKLQLKNTGVFENISEYEIAYTLCENPVPTVNDSKLVDGTVDGYALDRIDAFCAWSITKGDPRIIIGIADTDFQTTHEDLKHQIIQISGDITGGHIHGTRVAGSAAAEVNNNKGIAGIGYNSKIAAYRIRHDVSEDGKASASSLEIKNAVWQAFLDGCPIINVSWTGTGLNETAAREIINNGTTLVVAAGNSANSLSHSLIANTPGVINVSSSNKNDEYYENHARNQYVDICAPGIGIAAIAYAPDSYMHVWGTSHAAPIVAGTVALILSVNPCLIPSKIEEIIKTTADPLANAHLYPGLVGSGRLNAYAAVKKAMELGTRWIQWKYFMGSTVETAETTLKIGGYNPSSIFPNGRVIIYSGNNVTFRATHEIEFLSGFEVQSGATFTAEIYDSPCL